jgi:DNA repair protein RecO (recombination protein O)
MPIHEAEAIVIRQYPLADSDRIVVFVTQEFGKIRAVAKGVKKPQSRLAGRLEPLNHIRLEFYSRESRELGQIREAELIHSYLGKNPSLNQIYAFSYFAELANELVQDNQPNYALFRLLLASLEAGKSPSAIRPIVRYFEIWCLKLSGLLSNYAYCSNCGKCVKDDGFFAWLKDGHARCYTCAQGQGLQVRAAAAAALQAMMKLPPGQFGSLPLEADADLELERLAQGLLGLHLEKQLKSYRILREALQKQ